MDVISPPVSRRAVHGEEAHVRACEAVAEVVGERGARVGDDVEGPERGGALELWRGFEPGSAWVRGVGTYFDDVGDAEALARVGRDGERCYQTEQRRWVSGSCGGKTSKSLHA